MRSRGFALAFVFAAGIVCRAQAPFVEMWTGKVKQDKVAEFGALAVRVADANRRGNGDNFIAISDFYGRDNRVAVVWPRQSLADIEPAMGKFNAALKEFMGMTMDRFMADISRLVDDGRSQLWATRMEMSANLPAAEDWPKTIGAARYISITDLLLRPGHALDYDKQLTMIKQARESVSGEKFPAVVSVLVSGGSPIMVHTVIPLKSVADLEKVGSVRKLLGDSYESYSQMSAQNLARAEVALMRIVPEWSNPPKAIADADPKFWTTRSPAAMKPKPAAAPQPKPAKTGQ